MATAPTYCTHRQLKDVFPQVSSFDNKKALYGWTQEATLDDFGGTSNVNVWFAANTGLVTQLYQDGRELTSLSANLDTKATEVKSGTFSAVGTSMDVDSTTNMAANDILKINNEYIQISAVSDGDTIQYSGKRNLFGTLAQGGVADDDVFLVVDESSVDFADYGWFFYDSALDMCVVALPNNSNPNDILMEAGEDFSTLITRTTANASRYLDAKLDPNLPREQLKDKEGNYDYIIVRTSALIAATFLIRSHDPTSEVATALMEDAMGNIDSLNKGSAALSWQTTGDSSKGIIRDVTYTSSKVRPLDLKGRASGVDYDIIKVKIITGGNIGTATYSAWIKSSNGLKNTQVVTEQKITGDYQPLAYGLTIRFGGNDMSSTGTQAAANDEWEIEVAGWQEEVDNSSINSIRMTRGSNRTVYRYHRPQNLEN